MLSFDNIPIKEFSFDCRVTERAKKAILSCLWLLSRFGYFSFAMQWSTARVYGPMDLSLSRLISVLCLCFVFTQDLIEVQYKDIIHISIPRPFGQ